MKNKYGNKLFFDKSKTFVRPIGLPYKGPDETASPKADEPKE